MAAVKATQCAATRFVRRHASVYAPAISIQTVDALCAALGAISVEEATIVLDTLQAEAHG